MEKEKLDVEMSLPYWLARKEGAPSEDAIAFRAGLLFWLDRVTSESVAGNGGTLPEL